MIGSLIGNRLWFSCCPLSRLGAICRSLSSRISHDKCLVTFIKLTVYLSFVLVLFARCSIFSRVILVTFSLLIMISCWLVRLFQCPSCVTFRKRVLFKLRLWDFSTFTQCPPRDPSLSPSLTKLPSKLLNVSLSCFLKF